MFNTSLILMVYKYKSVSNNLKVFNTLYIDWTNIVHLKLLYLLHSPVTLEPLTKMFLNNDAF